MEHVSIRKKNYFKNILGIDMSFIESDALKALIPFTPGSCPVQPQSHLMVTD